MSEANKSLMLSEAEIIEAINSDSLICVSLGAGQPQKNVKISTLATVVAGIINPFRIRNLLTANNDLNGIADGVYWFVDTNNPKNVPGDAYNCIVIQFSNQTRGDKIQFLYSVNASKLYFRNCAISSWSSWKVITMS